MYYNWCHDSVFRVRNCQQVPKQLSDMIIHSGRASDGTAATAGISPHEESNQVIESDADAGVEQAIRLDDFEIGEPFREEKRRTGYYGGRVSENEEKSVCYTQGDAKRHAVKDYVKDYIKAEHEEDVEE